jgi:CRISPR-associated protein Csb3
MSDEKKANIQIPVDLTNPGQFFACCGLLELADRLWPGAEGWFEPTQFCIVTRDKSKSRADLLDAARTMKTWVENVLDDPLDDSDEYDSEESEKEPPFQPFELRSPDQKVRIYLDWWSDKSIKPWAGSMKDRTIIRAMLAAINPLSERPFDDCRAVFDQVKQPATERGKKPRKIKPQKREPFYFDPRRGNKSHPLDCGFSPDTHKMEAECCPALEALCFIGLQRARPAPTDVANRSCYTVWTNAMLGGPGLPANLVGAVTCAMIPWSSLGTYVFDNYFRTDQRKHKTFSQATLERSNHA